MLAYGLTFRQLISISILWAPTIILLLILSQMANVGNSLFLSFWTDQSLGFTQSGYMGAYAGLGAATAVTSFAVSYAFRYTRHFACRNKQLILCFSLMSVTAGFSMFRASLNGVLHSPVSWFDTTPVGEQSSTLSLWCLLTGP
jgi:ATP-binding cassette subfamily C (CFTR/MRP) protein 1